MKVHVLVPAAGVGRRVGAGVKKQYLMLGDRPLLAATLGRLAEHPRVTAIHVIAPEEEQDYCRREVVERYAVEKVAGVVVGGAERQDSVRNGLMACSAADQDIVLIHDAVRPFFPLPQLDTLLDEAEAKGASLLAVPVQDTVKEVVDGRVVRTAERSRLWLAQTPQAFRCALIREAHLRADQQGYRGTDDASLVEWCGWPVAVVQGSAYNLKVTTPADLVLARALLASGEMELS
jgi:2-C-methyl-D-erythritol 4-phosphate cytidylyltransferase